MANVIAGLIVTLALTIGPTLGGHLTESPSNWRWLFFVNVPPGLLVMFLVGRYADFDKATRPLAKGIDRLRPGDHDGLPALHAVRDRGGLGRAAGSRTTSSCG